MTEPSSAAPTAAPLPESGTAPAAPPASSAAAHSAGALLREARQRQGLHLAALAAAIKVTPAKLEALEADRYEALPDLTFARALAQACCRALKIDAAPVLALMPGAIGSRLERVDEGLNTPMPERGHGLPLAEWLPWQRPVPWIALVLLIAAGAFALLPSHKLFDDTPGSGADPVLPPASAASVALLGTVLPAPEPASGAALTVTAGASSTQPPGTVSTAAASTPGTSAGTSAGTNASAVADQPLQLRTLQDSWVQVSDADGKTLVARVMPAGETLSLGGALPLKLRIGNARGTQLQFRGQVVDLAAATRDNVATLTLPAP